MSVLAFAELIWVAKTVPRVSTRPALTGALARQVGLAFIARKRRTAVTVGPMSKFVGTEFASVNLAKEEATSAFVNR